MAGVKGQFAPFTLRAHALDLIARIHILTSLKQLECSFPTCADGRAVRARLNSVLHASCPYLIEVPSRIQFSLPG
jgi:hypothetical protein